MNCIHLKKDSSTIKGNVDFVHSQVQLYVYVTSVNLVFVSIEIINNSDNFRKYLSYSKISAILCVSLFDLVKHVKYLEKPWFFLLYLKIVTSFKIDPFLCCYLLYLIIYLVYT